MKLMKLGMKHSLCLISIVSKAQPSESMPTRKSCRRVKRPSGLSDMASHPAKSVYWTNGARSASKGALAGASGSDDRKTLRVAAAAVGAVLAAHHPGVVAGEQLVELAGALGLDEL